MTYKNKQNEEYQKNLDPDQSSISPCDVLLWYFNCEKRYDNLIIIPCMDIVVFPICAIHVLLSIIFFMLRNPYACSSVCMFVR